MKYLSLDGLLILWNNIKKYILNFTYSKLEIDIFESDNLKILGRVEDISDLNTYTKTSFREFCKPVIPMDNGPSINYGSFLNLWDSSKHSAMQFVSNTTGSKLYFRAKQSVNPEITYDWKEILFSSSDNGTYVLRGEPITSEPLPKDASGYKCKMYRYNSDNNWVQSLLLGSFVPSWQTWELAGPGKLREPGGNLRWRCGIDSSWESWRLIWDSSNHGIGSGLNADLLDGKHDNNFVLYDKELNLGDVSGLYSHIGSIIEYNDQPENLPILLQGGYISFGSLNNKQMQIYGAYADNRWFARGAGKMNDTYTDWREFAFTDSTINASKHINSTFLIDEDLNELNDLGVTTYYADGNNTCLNKPNNVLAFSLYVSLISDKYQYQNLTTADGIIYCRFKTNNIWSDWTQIPTVNTTVSSSKSLKIFDDNAYTILPDSSINDNDIKVIRPTNKSVEGLFESANNANVIFNITRHSRGFYYTLLGFSSSNLYIRNYNDTDNNINKKWEKILTDVTINDISINYKNVTKRQLFNATNIDNIQFPGIYMCDNKGTAATYQSGAILLVHNYVNPDNSDDIYVLQTLYDNDGRIKHRNYTSLSKEWSIWYYHNTISNRISIDNISTTINLNTYKSNTGINVYFISDSNLCVNKPNINTSFTLEVNNIDENNILQIITTIDNKIYIRTYTNNIWTEWKKMLTEDDILTLIDRISNIESKL